MRKIRRIREGKVGLIEKEGENDGFNKYFYKKLLDLWGGGLVEWFS